MIFGGFNYSMLEKGGYFAHNLKQCMELFNIQSNSSTKIFSFHTLKIALSLTRIETKVLLKICKNFVIHLPKINSQYFSWH